MIGERTPAVTLFWQQHKKQLNLQVSDYFAGTFAEPRFATYHDELLDLVAAGKKRATAHLSLDFERNNIRRRQVGDCWVVLNSRMDPRYLIRITDVTVLPFNEVDQTFAAREGEGDSSLAYWRRVHQEYFERQCEEWDIQWYSKMDTVCEGFELLASA